MIDFNDVIGHLRFLIKDKEFECGWMSDYTLSLVTAFIKYYRPDWIIHTGVLWGKSTAYILETLDTMSYDYDFEEVTTDRDYSNFINRNRRKIRNTGVILIDPDVFNLEIDKIVDYLRQEYPKIHVEYYKECSGDFFKYAKLPEHEFLLGIVDGDHTPDGCKLDLINLANAQAEVIIVDDVSWLPELDKVCSEFAEWHGYKYTKFEFDSGIGLLTKDE